MNPLHRSFAALFALLGALGCNSTAGVGYTPPSNLVAADTGAVVRVGAFQDARGKGPTDLGVVRGGYGNVLKRLYSEKPVAVLVADAFGDALAARGMLAPDRERARYVLAGRIDKLDCNQYMRREAHAWVTLRLETPEGREVWSEGYGADLSEGSAGIGVFGSLDGLRALAERALQDTVDEALDDPRFRAAVAKESVLPTAPRGDASSRLEELEELRRRGLIDGEEYERKRAEILDSL